MLVEGPMPVVVLLDAIMHHLQVCFSNPTFHFQRGLQVSSPHDRLQLF